jgi:hypothetical protein
MVWRMYPYSKEKEAAMGAVYVVVAFISVVFGVMSFASSKHDEK